jgi:hypothetical protein
MGLDPGSRREEFGASMLTYFLAQQADGRIVLDRELHGSLLDTFEVAEPPIVRRESDGQMVECPQYWESFAEARAKVETKDFARTPEGWFAKEKQ